MKKEYTFKNFYVHEGNKVAFLATKKIVEFPGEIFNPFYVYGGSGSGKTHLLRVIHGALSKKFTTLFLSAKSFERRVEEGAKFDRPTIVDDLHYVSDKYQPMILEIIDSFVANNIQLCFAGCAAPRDIKNFDPKLCSLLEGGLVCDLQPPKELALVDMIKKKSEEAGIILPDEVALELAQVSTGSIRTIEGMINRLVAYSSLGNMILDINSVRLILKEFYPKGIYSPVASLLEELKKSATDVLPDVSEKRNLRDEYRSKIYIWEMKGFDTSKLKPCLDGDIDTLKQSYENFIQKVESLIELQKEFGNLNTEHCPTLAMKIESLLFSPDKIEEVKNLINEIKGGVKIKEPFKTFDSYLIGLSNKNAYSIYKEQVLQNLGSAFNPFIVFGSSGTGKTHFLEAIYNDLGSQGKAVIFHDLASDSDIDLDKNIDVVVLDNFHAIVSLPEAKRKKIFDAILSCVSAEKVVIIAVNKLPSDLLLSDNEKSVFEFAVEVELSRPSCDMVEGYIRSKLSKSDAETMINKGLPEFESFYEIEEYLRPISIEAAPEVVPLGLPGEDYTEQVYLEEKAKKEVTVSTTEEAEDYASRAKALYEQRFILPEITGELIEEHY